MGDEEHQKKIEVCDDKVLTVHYSEDIDINSNGRDSAALVERLHGRIRELEALLGGKEEALQVALQGLDSATDVEKGYRSQLDGFRTRVGEFQEAVQQRDQVIQQLSTSLEHTLRDRDELAQDGERLAQEVSLLRSQLQATSQLMAQGSSKTQQDVMLLQNKVLALEDTLKKKDMRIEDLQRHMIDQQNLKKELEHKKSELAQYKSEAASHVQQLMREVERLHQQTAASASVESQHAKQIAALEGHHQQQLAVLRVELEQHFGQQLEAIQDKHRLHFSEQLEVLSKQHAGELASMSGVSPLDASESLDAQKQLEELGERALQVAAERDDLLAEIALYKDQVENLSVKLSEFSSNNVEEKKSSESSFETENISLKDQLKSLSHLLQVAQVEKEQKLKRLRESHNSEAVAWQKTVESLNLELQQTTKAAQSHLQRWEACSKNHETELHSLRESHAQELKMLREQAKGMEIMKAHVNSLQEKLHEKTEMEKRLQNELQMGVRREEELKERLLQTEEEVKRLNTALEKHKEHMQEQSFFVERVKAELLEKKKCETVLREELSLLKESLASAKETTDVLLYKEQVDNLNEQLKQKAKLEESLRMQVEEKDLLEQALRKGLEEQSQQYKIEFESLNKQLLEKVNIEEQLRTELKECMISGEKLQNELKSLRTALEAMKKSSEEIEVYRNQIEVLNRQLQEKSQSEKEIINDYESRLAVLTKEFQLVESRLNSEIEGIQSKACEELKVKQIAVKRLEEELEMVRNELLALKTSTQVQKYKEQINELNQLVKEKETMESTLKTELESVSAEVVLLKEHQKQLESFNSDLMERLQTEQRLQEELIAAAKMHKEQVDVLSAKISELTSQQNSLDNETMSMRQEMEAQKSYIHDLEMMKEQVSQSSKTKEALINDLSVCVKSLTEDNSLYQQKLETLNKRLDDECHRADENMALREMYEKEITVLKKNRQELERKLQETLLRKEEQLQETSCYKAELESYKQQVENLKEELSTKISELQKENTKLLVNKAKEAEALAKEVSHLRMELTKNKENLELLNIALTDKGKIEEELSKQVKSYGAEVESLKMQILEVTEMKGEKEKETSSCMQLVDDLNSKLKIMEEEKLQCEEMFKSDLQCLEENIITKNEVITRLNLELEEAACKFDDLKKLFEEAQQRFSEEREVNSKLKWEKQEMEASYKMKLEKLSETHQIEMEDCACNIAALQSGIQELVSHEKSSKDRDSLNFSSISDTELLQLESKLQHALSERNEIEKSFKDHVNRLAESHSKEMAAYEEQLRTVNEKLNEVTVAHMNCIPMIDKFTAHLSKLRDDHQKEIDMLKGELQESYVKCEEMIKCHKDCASEKEAVKNSSFKEIEKYKLEITECKDKIAQANKIIEELSAHNCDLMLKKDYLNNRQEETFRVEEKNATSNEEKTNQAGILVESSEDRKQLANVEEIQDAERKNVSCEEQLKLAVSDIKSLSQAHAKCIEEKAAFKEMIQNLSENHQKELTMYREQLTETKNTLKLVSNELESIVTENCSLKDNVAHLTSKIQEINLLKEELSAANVKLDELDHNYKKCLSEKETLLCAVSERDHVLIEKNENIQLITNDLSVCQRELTQTREYMDLLKVNLQDEISKVHVELQNLVNICTPSTEFISEKGKLDVKSLTSESSVMNGDESLSPDGWRVKDGNGSLEDSFVCAATIHHDVSSLRSQVECLVSDLNAARQKSSLTEEMLATIQGHEEILKEQISELEGNIKEANETNKTLQVQLEELTVKYLASESLLAGKIEAELSLQKEISEMESRECNRCKHLAEEMHRLTIGHDSLKEKCRLLEIELEKVIRENSELEMTCKKVCEEKSDLEKVIENLKQEQIVQSSNFAASAGESCSSDRAHSHLTTLYSALKEDHHKLLLEKRTIEEVLEKTKAEVARLHELHNTITSGSSTSSKTRDLVEKGAQEQMESVKETRVCFTEQESHADELSVFDLPDISFPEIQGNADGNSVGAVGNSSSIGNARRSSLHTIVLKLMHQCSLLNTAKNSLLSECEVLRSRLEESEAQELLSNEELAAVTSKCAALEQRLKEARSHESTREALAAAKLALECEVRVLEGRNSALQAARASLEEELLTLREARMSDDGSSDITALAAQLKAAERDRESLQIRIDALEAAKSDMLQQFQAYLEDARLTREQLEDAWQERADAEELLGRARCELALVGLRHSGAHGSVREILPSLPASEANNPVFNIHKEVHDMVEEMAQELVSLRRALHSERMNSERLSLEGKMQEQTEMKQKLELVLKSNSELLQEKQVLLECLQKNQEYADAKGWTKSSGIEECSSLQSDLMTQLSVYREQHASLSESIGSAGVLQETLRQQKEELIAKLKEKEAVEELLAAERAELECSRLKIQLMQQQLNDKDNMYQELYIQKTNLEKELEKLEVKLHEREKTLQLQRMQLQAEIRSQDVRLRRWQLHQRAAEVEKRLDSSLKLPLALTHTQSSHEDEVPALEVQARLEAVRVEMQEVHAEALARLRRHLNSEFAVREQALRAEFSAELSSAQVSHREQLARLQQDLLAVEKELENLRNAETIQTLGSSSKTAEDMIDFKKKYEQELESICLGLDEGQAHLFAVLKHLFEEFARQLLAGTTALHQKQQEQRSKRETMALEAKHQLELKQLQEKLEREFRKSLENLEKIVKNNFEEDPKKEPVFTSVSTCPVVHLHSADSSQVALVQLKHLLYSEYTTTLKEVTSSWSEEWKTEVHAQMEALERDLAEEALSLKRLRDSPDSLQQSLINSRDEKTLEEKLSLAEKLITKAEDLLERQVSVSEMALRAVDERLEASFAPVVKRARSMAGSYPSSMDTLPTTTTKEADEERDAYRRLAHTLAEEHAAEAGRLREALAALEARRAAEMEELRRYFEQKVQELEKHYSEEITSQHSRRISSSSCDSDSEFSTDALLGAGDHALPRIPPLTHICDSCAADPGYKELEERWRKELEKRVEESRSQLSIAKREIEAHYESELSGLRCQYEEKLSHMAQDLSLAQQTAVKNAKTSFGKHLQNLWRKELQAIRSRMISRELEVSTSMVRGTVQEKESGLLLEGDELANVDCCEDLCVELRSQLRQLEAAWRQSLMQQKEQWLKERAMVEVAEAEEQAVEQASVLSVQEALAKVQIEEILRREIREELEKELEEQVEKVAELMKTSAEMEQKMFIENQNQMMKEFLEQHRQDLETLKQQHLMDLAEASSRSISKKESLSDCQFSESSSQHGGTQTEQLPKKLDVSLEHCTKKDKGVQTDKQEICVVPTASHAIQTSPIVTHSLSLDASTERLRAQVFECSSLSLNLEAPSFPEPEVDVEDEHENSFRRALVEAQGEHAKIIQAMLMEWMKILQRVQLGMYAEESDAKAIAEEYISEYCVKFKALLCTLESLHLSEISRLQENLQRQIPVSRSPSVVQDQCNEDQFPSEKYAEIIGERDRWRQVGLVLKKLVEELLSYLEECEDEVNHTLLSEPVDTEKMEETLDAFTSPLPTPTPTPDQTSLPVTPVHKRTKRVRFAPTCLDFKMLFSDEKMLLDCIQEDKDLSGKLRMELDACLDHLRSEAALLAENSFLGSTPLHKNSDKDQEELINALTAARHRVAELEAERKGILGCAEEVAEGFGEQQSPLTHGPAIGQRLHSLSQLQDKARSILAVGRPSSPQEAQQLQILDEICREGERLAEEAHREREDLRLQVESADKRLRDTRRFLEEQAAEREQERDEFQQELNRLQDQLKAREKDLADQQRLSREVEALEQQSKEAMARHQELEVEREALQAELKAAVDKVWLLRDVVAELELQGEAKDARASHMESRIQELEQALEEQEQSHQQLCDELETLRSEGGAELSRQVAVLQEQLQAHRLQAELCKPAALKQMKALIRELEISIDKRTHQLEALHIVSSNQSSPSEDISVRDIFQCESPEEMRAALSPSLQGSPVSPLSPPPTPLPLRELTRLQDRLQRHARAEEAALKRTRDLEMQLKASRKAEEEACAERDMMQERVSNQLLRIASLEASVDAGRWKGTINEKEDEEDDEEEAKEMQMLQRRVHDAEEETERLANELLVAQKELQQVKETAAQFEAAAAEREQTLATRLTCAEEAEVAFRERYEALQLEIDELHKSVGPCSGNRLIPLPALFDALLADKNAEIDTLRRRLGDHGVPSSSVLPPIKTSGDSRDIEDIVAMHRPPNEDGSNFGGTEHRLCGGGIDDDSGSTSASASSTTNTGLTTTCQRVGLTSVASRVHDSVGDSGNVESSTTSANAELNTRDEVNRLRSQLKAARAEVEVLRGEVAEVPALQMLIRVEQQRADTLQTQLTTLEADRARMDALLQQTIQLKGRLKMADEEHERAEALQAQLDALRETSAKIQESVGKETTRQDAATSPLPSSDSGTHRQLHPPKVYTLQSIPEPSIPVLTSQSRKESEEATAISQDSVALLHSRVVELQQLLFDTTKERDDLRRMTEPNAIPQPHAGLEELEGQVERELVEAVQLDSSLLNHIAEAGVTKDAQVHNCNHPHDDDDCSKIEDAVLIKELEQSLEQLKKETKIQAERERELQKRVCTEQERADELQRALRLEQQRSLDLQSQLASQAVRAGLATEDPRLLYSSWEVQQERDKVHILEQKLLAERDTLLQLKNKLLSERQRFDSLQKRDAELLMSMRQRLHEANIAKKSSTSIQITPSTPMPSTSTTKEAPQATEGGKNTSQISVHPQSGILSLSVNNKQDDDLRGTAGDTKDPMWVPAEIHAELQRRLEATEEEMKVLRRRYNREREATQQLRAEVSLLRGHNNNLDSQLSEVRSSLAVSQSENDRLARRLRALEEADLRQQNWASTEWSLAQEKSRQLEANVMRLEAELAAEQAVREDAVSENACLRGEVDVLRRQLESAMTSQSENAKQASPVLGVASLCLKDMNLSLDQQMRDHSKVAITLARLLEERQELQCKLSTFNELISSLKAKEDASQVTITRLSAEKSKITEECIQLRLALARVKESLCQRAREMPDIEELEDRANRTYGRYLRAESYRKALVWQKKYLLVAMGGYQKSEASTLTHLAALAPVGSHTSGNERREHPRVCFRSAVVAVVAIQRMKFLVKRWSNHEYCARNELRPSNYVESRFSGRRSVTGLRSGGGGSFATSSTWSIPASASLGVVLHSPPSQDRASPWHRPEPTSLPNWRSMDALSGNLVSSQISQFVGRSEMLQQRLSLVTASKTSLSTSKSPQRDDN